MTAFKLYALILLLCVPLIVEIKINQYKWQTNVVEGKQQT